MALDFRVSVRYHACPFTYTYPTATGLILKASYPFPMKIVLSSQESRDCHRESLESSSHDELRGTLQPKRCFGYMELSYKKLDKTSE